MKNMLEALKKVRGSMKPEDKSPDKAPILDSKAQPSEGLLEGDAVEMEEPGEKMDDAKEIMALSDEEKARLLESLISEPNGRSPMGLRERASVKMGQDLSALKK